MARNSKGQIVAAFTYDHDQVGNRLSKAMPDKRYDYDYDAIYRLLEASPVRINKKGKEIEDKHNTEGFSYDPVGNRLSGPEWKDSYAYDNGNQLLDSRKYDYQYDSNGNLISKIEFDDDDQASWTYEYDYENRLVRAIKIEEDETKIVSFKYDPFNRRIEKKVEEIEEDAVEAKTFTYVYDGANLILEIKTGGDGKGKEKATRYVYGLGTSEPLAIEQKGEVYYYHLDGLNTPTALTDPKGKVVVSYEYSAFGKRTHYGNRVKQYLTFPGQYYDEETGLHYNWNRYYDPATGTYITVDPIGLKGGINLYGYANGNPVNAADPTGLAVWICYRPMTGLIGYAANLINSNYHAYIWLDSKKEGYGLAPKNLFQPSSINLIVDGYIKREQIQLSCRKIYDCLEQEEKVAEFIKKEDRSQWLRYDPFSNNCNHWADRALQSASD
jgi:RHS repeat-associated protein